MPKIHILGVLAQPVPMLPDPQLSIEDGGPWRLGKGSETTYIDASSRRTISEKTVLQQKSLYAMS